MTAAEVRACLALRWPDSEYLCIAEAPDAPHRQGRKLDLLAISLWASRGHQLEGVEIKVSLSDWKRELAEGSKADFWFTHTHRFWLAVPAALAPKVRDDLPRPWGLLACEVGTAPKVVVKAPAHDAVPLTWAHAVGLCRASADAGLNALRRAETRGREQGYTEGKRDAERFSGAGREVDALAALRETVSRFEAASGIDLNREYDVERIGKAVALARRELEKPGDVLGEIGFAADAAERAAEQLRSHATKLRGAIANVSARLSLPADPAPTSRSGAAGVAVAASQAGAS